MSSRLALLTPFASPSVRGNAVTVERIVRGLRDAGVDLRVWDLSTTPDSQVEMEVEASRPGLVHAFHAYRVGPLALRLARRLEVPLVVTLTGTDANHDLFDPDRAATVRRVLEGATRLVAFHESIAEVVGAALPDLRDRLRVVPQAAYLPDSEPYDLAARWALPAQRVLFMVPAGIRPVKNVRFPLQPLAHVVARHPEVRLLYAGPILDHADGDALLRDLVGRPWAHHVGSVRHGQMASLLAQCDVVVNCSLSEGGMANSVLEAMAMARPVLASDIPGNRSLVEDGVTGLLFGDAAQLEQAAERLVVDGALRARLGAAGRERVQARYPAGREIDRHLALYRTLLPVPIA